MQILQLPGKIYLSGETLLTFLVDGKLDTVALRQRHPSGAFRADGEHVSKTGREFLSGLVLDEHNVERTWVLLDVEKFSNASTITSLGDGDGSASSELDDVGGLTGSEIDLDSVVHFDKRVRVTDGAAVVGDNGRDSLCAVVLLLDTTQFESRLLLVNAVQDETSLGIEEQTEGIVGLRDGDNIHESCREVGVGADTSINLDNLLHADLLDFLHVECVLQTVTEDDAQRKALAHLVRSRGWSWCPDTIELSKHPVGRRMKALQVLLRSASHD